MKTTIQYLSRFDTVHLQYMYLCSMIHTNHTSPPANTMYSIESQSSQSNLVCPALRRRAGDPINKCAGFN